MQVVRYLVVSMLALAPYAGALQKSPARPAATAIPDHLVNEATSVKERHVASLFRLPAVVGVGVGASRQHPGKAAILVYVSRKLKDKERRAFPAELERVPVEIEVSGPFVALPEGAKAKERGAKR